MKKTYRIKTNNQEQLQRKQNESDATSKWIEFQKTRPRRRIQDKDVPVLWDSYIYNRKVHGKLIASWKISSLAVNGQSFLVIDGYLWQLCDHEYQAVKKRYEPIWTRLSSHHFFLPEIQTSGERILKVTKKSGNRGRCRKLCLWKCLWYWNRMPMKTKGLQVNEQQSSPLPKL